MNAATRIAYPFPWGSTLALALIYMCRMLGLFMILPVFSLYSEQLSGHNSFLMGLALGAYGLAQVILQLPMGLWSDRYGRKRIMTFGLLLFLIGSLVAGSSMHIWGVILGRFLQGSGAISGVALALVADVTPVPYRVMAMAVIGVSIGVSFMLAMLLGPFLASWVAVSGLFYITAGLSLLSIGLLHGVVPSAPCLEKIQQGRMAERVKDIAQLLIKNSVLRFLYGSVWLLHLILTALFLALPLVLKQGAASAMGAQATWYAQVLGPAFLILVPIMGAARRLKTLQGAVGAIGLMALALLGIALGAHDATVLWLAMVLFFVGFGFLEASLPAFLSRFLPESVRGTGLSLFSMSQFFGVFCGGIAGGVLLGQSGPMGILSGLAILAGFWLLASWRRRGDLIP